MEIKKLSKDQIMMMLSDSKSLTTLSDKIMESYNSVLDNIMSTIDASSTLTIMSQQSNITNELKTLLDNAGKGKVNFRDLFKSKKAVAGGLKQKADDIMGRYKMGYDGLCSSVGVQVAKGQIMEQYLLYFSEVEQILEEQLESITDYLLRAEVDTILKNVKKMNVAMEQKMGLMQSSIKQSIELRTEMGFAIGHFSGLVKDMLISISMQGIVDSAADLMKGMRETIEEYNEKTARLSIESAEKIDEIRQHGVISMQALGTMNQVVQSAHQKMLALSDKRSKQLESDEIQLRAIKQQSQNLLSITQQ